MNWVGTAAVAAVLLAMTGGAWAEGGASGHGAPAHGAAGQAAAAPKPAMKRMTLPVSPVSLIEGSRSAWSVSDAEAGCYLMSPLRKNSSRVAIGRHPELGSGLFVVNIGLSVPGAVQNERIAVQTADGALAKDGRMVGMALLFMPLNQVEMDQVLLTLSGDGTLRLIIRDAWLSHAGMDLSAAVDGFHKQCDQKPGTAGPAAAAAPVARVGSKSASAP